VLGGMPRFVWGAIATGVAVAALAMAATPARATTDRVDYDAQVNPICASANAEAKQLYESAEQTFARLDRKADKARGKKRKKLEARSERLFEQLPDLSLAIYFRELDRLKGVPPATGDETLVSDWLTNRQTALDLTAQANRIGKRADRLFTKGFRGHTLKAIQRWEKKFKKLQQQVNQIYQELEPLNERDIELGTQLGATYCVTFATGQP
jgi:ribosome-associated translation inhibitor RaiA